MTGKKYTYRCEHPESEVLIKTSKPYNDTLCPLCAAKMKQVLAEGVSVSIHGTCPGCGEPLYPFQNSWDSTGGPQVLKGYECRNKMCNYKIYV